MIIARMKDLSYEHQIAIRSTAKAVLALDNLVAALRASSRVKFRGKKITKEAVVNAVWLWLSQMPLEDVEANLAKYVPIFEGMLSETSEAAPPAEFDPNKVHHGVDAQKAPKPKRGSGKSG